MQKIIIYHKKSFNDLFIFTYYFGLESEIFSLILSKIEIKKLGVYLQTSRLIYE